jgi:hypothetical protein
MDSALGVGLAEPTDHGAGQRGEREPPGFVVRITLLIVHGLERLGRGQAAGKRQLIDVDLLALHRDRHEHAQARHRACPQRQLHARQCLPGAQVERRHGADEDRARHVAGSGGRRRHHVVLQDRELVLGQRGNEPLQR